jgi:hypothetical protein
MTPQTVTAWTEPGTDQSYPTAYGAYRRAREAQERPLARHRALGPDIDHYLWRRAQAAGDTEIDVRLTIRHDAPPRVRRIIAEVLCAIRRGQPANDAIRRVARRFGLRHGRARAFITTAIAFEVRTLAAEADYIE